MTNIFEDTDKAPHYTEQAPYIKAFRRYIRNPENKTQTGRGWTAKVLLEELWKLWDHPKSSKWSKKFFSDQFQRRIEDLRGNMPQSRITSGLLFSLIVRFIESRNIFVAGDEIAKIEAAANSLSFIIPASPYFSPAGIKLKPGEIEVLEITYPLSRQGRTEYIALKVPYTAHPKPFCIAIHFHEALYLGIGAFSFSLHDAFINESINAGYSYLRFIFSARQLQEFLVAAPKTPPMLHVPCLENEDMDWKRTDNVEAIAFATSYFKNIDI